MNAIKMIIPFIFLGLIPLSYAVESIPECDDYSFDYDLGPNWLHQIKICFPNEKGLLSLDMETPFFINAIVDEPTDQIRLYLIHSSHLGFFDPEGTDYKRILQERQDAGLLEDHVHGVSDRKFSFSIKLTNATHNTINCKKIISEEGNLIDEPSCNYSYEGLANLKFLVPGNYYYVLIMKTLDGDILTDFRKDVPIFKVLSNEEELQLLANQIKIGEWNSRLVLPEPFNQFNEMGQLAQWLIFLVLAATAFAIGIQISNQTRARKGENYWKMVDRLDSLDFLKSFDIIKDEFNKNPESLKKPDSKLIPELKEHISHLRQTYQTIGSMIYQRTIDEYEFCDTYALQGRDAWKFLKDNVSLTNDEIKKIETVEDMYFKFFRYLGDMCTFWLSLSPYERRFHVNNRILSPRPDTLHYIIRTHIRKIKTKLLQYRNKNNS